MTDSDIIKALECCTGKEGGCNGCIFNDEDDIYCWSCEWELKNAAMEVIKRQQAEIERLKAEKDNLIRNYKECAMEAVKEFAERLKAKVTYFEYRLEDGDELFKAVELDAIDALVEEMEGENEENPQAKDFAGGMQNLPR